MASQLTNIFFFFQTPMGIKASGILQLDFTRKGQQYIFMTCSLDYISLLALWHN